MWRVILSALLLAIVTSCKLCSVKCLFFFLFRDFGTSDYNLKVLVHFYLQHLIKQRVDNVRLEN